ncbi:MAG: right-handed parallel beta-helix repeat-containing protein [Candidatus Marinimicrobia bacterium]|nr:right-handed parallel beta-helix repeat-containing protein [Candidatus Neomarinimicrobiota bacterium]
MYRSMIFISAFIILSNQILADVTAELTLIDGSGLEVLNYESGDVLYVRVEDTDANGDGGTVEIINVTVTSETETAGETLTLTETGINTGIFEGSMSFQEAAANNGDGILQVARGDKLTGSYDDPADDFGNPVTVTDVAFYGVTLMSGTLYGPNTWTLANSPYLITGDVTIGSESSLTIEPGVEVRFVPSSDDLNSGNDVNRSELYVYGTLIAEGTASDHIIFTSNSESPSSGDWYGIYFRDQNADLSMSYCDLSYSTFGVYFQNMWRDPVDTISIYNSTFHDMGNAIREDNWSNRYYEVVGNHIYDCSGYGIQSQWSGRHGEWMISDNVIENTLQSGIYIQDKNRVVISSTIIDGGNDWGMQFHQVNTVEITGCNVLNKTSGGIYTNDVSDLTVNGSTISGNNNWGMQVHRSNGLLDNNEVSGNGNGIYVYSDAERPILVTLNNNRIINNNDQGIRVEHYGKVVANNNDLYGNNWDFYNNSPAWPEVDARYNWWGQTTTDSMDAGNNPKNIQKIWDYYDDNNYGFVNYGGWLLEPFDAPLGPLSLSIEEYQVNHGDTILIALNTTIPTDTSFISSEINISGFQGILEFLEIVTENSMLGYSGWSITVNATDSLLITASAGATPINGDGVLFWLKFAIPDTTSSQTVPLNIISAIYNTGEIEIDTQNGYINVLWEPIADFTASITTGGYPLVVQFTDHSIQGTYPIVTWNWDFGDSSFSSEQNPLQTYLQPGDFSVTLTVTDSSGMTSTITRTDYINILGLYGDVDFNTIVQAYDAGLILQHLVGLINLNDAQQNIGNVSLDTTLSALDASLILRYVTSLIDTLPYDTSMGSLLASGSFEMGFNTVSPGSTVDIPLFINDGNNIYSFEGTIRFNNELIRIDTIMWAESLDGFVIETIIDTNQITVVGAGTVPDGTDELFATVRITLDENIEDFSVVLLENFRLNENPMISSVMIGGLMLSLGDEAALPTEYALRQNYPNPFNPMTTINYDLPENTHVRLLIYDIMGREIINLVNQHQQAGYKSVRWNGRNNSGQVVSAGMYIFSIDAGNYRAIKKMILLK